MAGTGGAPFLVGCCLVGGPTVSSGCCLLLTRHVRSLNKLTKVLQYTHSLGLWFGSLGSVLALASGRYDGLRLVLLSDASWDRELGNRSQGGCWLF